MYRKAVFDYLDVRNVDPVAMVTVSQLHANTRTPLVVTDLMRTWKAFPKWNFTYFKQAFPKHGVTADRRDNGKPSYIYTTFTEYIDYALTSNELNPYYGKSLLHLTNDLQFEYDVPANFKCWYKNYKKRSGEEQNIELSLIYLGPRHSTSPLHIDIWGTSFWNALFEGKKLWFFLPPEQAHLAYDGKVDPFEPDLNAFPDFEKVRPIIHIQNPGELVYCPGNIWHAVYAMEPSIALSENFINQENYRNVQQHFQKHGYDRALTKLNHIVSNYVEQ
jgi:hypothetical protein